jgi:CubicO group peptidase (beta-lactamase class C family)
MQHCLKLISLLLLLSACQPRPLPWSGPELTLPRDQLTVAELVAGTPQPLLDMSFFARPAWADSALAPFSGTLLLQETELTYPKEKAYYPGENIFPRLELDFIARRGELIPRQTGRISTRGQGNSYWDVLVGAGKVWHEAADGSWSRASFPLTLTDRWVGQARNCVATFVYRTDSISPVCLQCSQETADIDDRQLGNISGMLPADFRARSFADSSQVVERHRQAAARRLPVQPLREIDVNRAVADYFERANVTNAPTSLGAVWLDSVLYLHPPQTRHGPYPYPGEMRHGLYSVTKSMAGALALFYFAERYEEDVFKALITDYVPALADHPGWQGVTFAHTLNMVTGTVGSERLEHLYSTLIVAESAEEAIRNIATLGDAPPAPGQQFNYASTNLFVLSYALQRYVEEREDEPVNYWELVRENVLVPIGAPQFTVLRTQEGDDNQGIPILAYGALPTIDEAAKIALLLANAGRYAGQQLLNRERVQEAFGKTEWAGYSTNNDFRGQNYKHSFWSKAVQTGDCTIEATYMLGFGENYVVFLPSGAIIFRFYDEHDLDIDKLIRAVEKMRSSCSSYET